MLIPILVLSSFITYSLGALSNSNPAATILGQDAATPAADPGGGDTEPAPPGRDGPGARAAWSRAGQFSARQFYDCHRVSRPP